jgi:hypothetical protein
VANNVGKLVYHGWKLAKIDPELVPNDKNWSKMSKLGQTLVKKWTKVSKIFESNRNVLRQVEWWLKNG